MTVSTSAAGISATAFERQAEMSMPISFKTAMASGRTLVGREPADQTLTSGGRKARAMPSAIWLRAELATQRKQHAAHRAPPSAVVVAPSPPAKQRSRRS
jgi:hypothetical protein